VAGVTRPQQVAVDRRDEARVGGSTHHDDRPWAQQRIEPTRIALRGPACLQHNVVRQAARHGAFRLSPCA
jgi:hypothetical protein